MVPGHNSQNKNCNTNCSGERYCVLCPVYSRQIDKKGQPFLGCPLLFIPASLFCLLAAVTLDSDMLTYFSPHLSRFEGEQVTSESSIRYRKK
jgi:hypothetical protein